VSGLNGVEELKITGNKLQLIKIYNKRNGAGSDYVYQVYHDGKGRKWLATDGGGVTMYSNGVFKQFTTADGLPGNVVYTLTEDAYGIIWASVLDAGICWFDGKRWHKLSQQYGLSDVNVATLAANKTGQVIAVHKKGLDIWYPQSKQFRSYSRRQGMHIDSVSDILKLYAKDIKGNVYVPFEQGFIMIKNNNARYDIRPDIRIQSLSVFFKEEDRKTYRFDHNQNHISFK
jgi:ligand-binding sensor domain-containing protein